MIFNTWPTFFKVAFVVVCDDSILSILFPNKVIGFASSVATFHLSSSRHFYGQPSLLETIRSQVSLIPSPCNITLEKSLCFPFAHAYWLKYLLTVPHLTCNLMLTAAERESHDKLSLGVNMLYGFRIPSTKLGLSVPLVP